MIRPLFLACLLAAAPAADILLPGHTGVSHTFEIQGLEQAPAGTSFFLFPHHLSQPPKPVLPGQAFSFYKHNSPHLFAIAGEVPEAMPEDSDWDEAFLDEPGVQHSEILFSKISSVPAWEATREIHTVYRFDGLEGNTIRLELVSETHTDALGNEVSARDLDSRLWMLGLAGVALFGLLALVVVRRKRFIATSG